MLKWFLRILYAFIVVIIGIMVLNEGFANKRLTYLEENAQTHFDENNMDSYLAEYNVAAERYRYVEQPLYNAVSNDSIFGFEFSIYHTQVAVKDGSANVLVFILHNLDINEPPLNEEEFDKNNNLVRIRVSMQFENGLYQQDYNLDGNIMPLPSPYAMDVAIPMEIQVVENGEEGKSFKVDEGITGKLEEVKFELIDSTLYENEPKRTIFAVFKSNDTVEEKYLVHEELIKDTVITTDHNNETVELTNTLTSKLFNGTIERFDVEYLYDEENPDITIGISDLSKLNSYNSIVVKYVSIFLIIAIIITYLLFFLNPTIKYFKNKKAKNIDGIIKEADQKKTIFTDE